ncbi:MAG: pilus assembly protein PilM [Chloroflexi bacterium]|nr:pilus assembly protein PilM [Chloroflexota bacterium]
MSPFARWKSLFERTSASLRAHQPNVPVRLRQILAPVRQRLQVVAEHQPGSPASEGASRVAQAVSLARGTKGTRVTVDLSPDAIRLLEMSQQRVTRWWSFELDGAFVRDGLVVQPAALAGILNQKFRQLQLPRHGILAALSGVQAHSTIVDLPSARYRDVGRYVEEEVERRLGLAMEDCYLHWVSLAPARRERDVFACAVRREPVQALAETFTEANLELRAIDLKPLALARAVGCRDAIIAHLEGFGLDIIIVQADLPLLIRSLPLDRGVLDREALQDRLLREVERSLLMYADLRERPLDPSVPLVLSGSLASGIALAERLRAAIRHPLGRPEPPIEYPPEFPLTDFLVNVGLALKSS